MHQELPDRPAPFDWQRFERFDAKGEVRRNRLVAVNVLFFLGEIVRVSFHIDQEFRFGIPGYIDGKNIHPPTSIAARNSCRTEPQ